MDMLAARRESRNTTLAAHNVRFAAGRCTNMIAYLTIFAATLSGYTGLGPWTVAMTTAALVALSQFEYGGLYKRAQDLGFDDAAQSTLLQSILNGFVATSVAYAFGWVLQIT